MTIMDSYGIQVKVPRRMIICLTLGISLLIKTGLSLDKSNCAVIHIGGFYSSKGSLFDSSGIIPAVELAINEINTRSDILSNYKLQMIWNDTKCDIGMGVKALIDQVFYGPQIFLILGPPCSENAHSVTDVARFYQLITISSSATSPALSDKKRFPYFFRTNAIDRVFNPARIFLMKKFNWTRVTTIHEQLELFSSAINDMHNLLDKENFTLISSESFTGSATSVVKHLKKTDARIIITNMYEASARQLFCEAYKQELYGENYVWLMIGWYVPNWWRIKNDTNCTTGEIEKAINGSNYISMDIRSITDDTQTSISRRTGANFKTEMEKRSQGNETNTLNNVASYGYDAAWAAGILLNQTEEVLRKGNHSLGTPPNSLLNFSYTDSATGKLMLDILKTRTRFAGITGNVSFDKDRDGIVEIRQLIGLTEEVMVLFSTDETKILRSFTWAGGRKRPPSDRQPDIMVTIPTGWLLTMALLSAIGLIMCAGFTVFNQLCRKYPIIKLSSPNVNNIILLGCALTYLSVLVHSLESSMNDISRCCQARTWLLSIGFVLAFGAIFGKTWRVYRIATLKSLQRRVIPDNQLYLMVLVMVLFDIFVLFLWRVADPIYQYQQKIPMIVESTANYYFNYCKSDFFQYWVGVLFIFKGMLLMFGVFLAWETRKVKIPALNDSRSVAICIYNISLIYIIQFIVSAAFVKNPIYLYIFVSSFNILAATSITVIMFVPKICSVLKDGKDVVIGLNTSKTPESSQNAAEKNRIHASASLDKSIEE